MCTFLEAMAIKTIKNSVLPYLAFSRKKNSSLIRRFQMVLVTWGTVVYLFAVTGFWYLSDQVIHENARRQAMLWVDKLDMLSTPLYVSGNNNEFGTIKRYIEGFSQVSYFRLYHANGTDVFSEYFSESFSKGQLPTFNPDMLNSASEQQLKDGYSVFFPLQDKSSVIRVVAPVTTVSTAPDQLLNFDLDSRQHETVAVIGYIDLGLNSDEYRKQLAQYILYGSLFISIVFLIAAIVGRILIEKTLQPLRDLREPLNRLAQGDTDVWLSRSGDDEIAAIGRALSTTISAIKGRDAQLQRLADYDALTGLVSKRRFHQLLDEERQRVISGADSSALFFIDLDQFKFVNETLGYASGDRLLVKIAALLSNCARKGDVVSRLGSDEFAVLAKSVDSKAAVEMAGSIIKSLYDFTFSEQGKTFNVYCSIGISLLSKNEFTTEEVFSQADMACFCAKSQGRNRYHMYEAQTLIKNKIDIAWSHRLADALANDKFQLHYQPIACTGGSDQLSFEVLLRMVGDSGELISPGAFIRVAECFGLATEIDYWVIENGMKALEACNQQGLYPRFYINLSGQLFSDPDFVGRVVHLLGVLQIDAKQIVFELTERTAVGDIQNASEKMRRLKAYGFEFAVDDFGSGFSSFSYLKHMPVKYVKIEGEFVERITYDEVDRAMVKSMVDIAKACGKKVIAEYVGNQETLNLLKHFGVDYVQGYFIAKPNVSPVQ